jgi:XTP/dITP diphosphohydrolase
MEIVFVTTNRNKIASLERALAPFGVTLRPHDLELPEPQVADIRAIAEHKARAAYEALKVPLVVQDTGFFMDATPGFPGAFVKFAKATLGVEGFLKLARGESRVCAFRECLIYHDGTDLHPFESHVPGTLAEAPSGTYIADRTELWNIFIPEGFTKTLGEMDESELAQWRTRRPKNWSALFAEWFSTRTAA